jgi:hypothetical protein
MGERKTFALVTITAEPTPTRADASKVYWTAADGDDQRWLVWSKALADAIRERKGEVLEYEVYEKKDGEGKVTSRTISGLPGVVEAEQRGGNRGGGRPWTPPDYNAQEAAKHPSFAWAYVKDLVVAGKVDLSDMEREASRCLAWLRKNSAAPASAAPQAAAPAQRPATPAPVAAKPPAPTPAPAATAPPDPYANGWPEETPASAAPTAPTAGEAAELLADAIKNFGGRFKVVKAASVVLKRSLSSNDLELLTAEELHQILAHGPVAA